MQQSLLNLIGAVAGMLVSLVAEFIPAYQGLNKQQKRLVMVGLLIVSSAFVFSLSCLNALDILIPGLGVACTTAGAVAFVQILISALVANQGFHAINPARQEPPALPPPDAERS